MSMEPQVRPDPGTLREPEVIKARHPFTEAWEMFRGNHAAMAGLVVLCLIALGAVFGPMLYPVDPFEMVWAPFSPPGVDGFILGTDYLGRDLVAALLGGARVSLIIGLAAAFVTVAIGVTAQNIGGIAAARLQLGLGHETIVIGVESVERVTLGDLKLGAVKGTIAIGIISVQQALLGHKRGGECDQAGREG